MDKTLLNVETQDSLQIALDAVHYWLLNSAAFRESLAMLVVDYQVAEKSKSQLINYLIKSKQDLLSKLEAFLKNKSLPIIRIQASLGAKYGKESDIYGAFDPSENCYIYINSAMVKQAAITPEPGLQISFLIFSKIIHELSHWITHFTMKNEEFLLTPSGFYGGEAGEFIEIEMFGDVVHHHSKSDVCPWEVELVIKAESTGSKSADYFQAEFMKLFFDKNVADSCTDFATLQATSYTSSIYDRRLATVTKVSTHDEFGNKKQDGRTKNISLEDVGGQYFIGRCIGHNF